MDYVERFPARQNFKAPALSTPAKALKAAKTFQEREEHLLSLAEDYFHISESNSTAAIEKKSQNYANNEHRQRKHLRVNRPKSSHASKRKA